MCGSGWWTRVRFCQERGKSCASNKPLRGEKPTEAAMAVADDEEMAHAIGNTCYVNSGKTERGKKRTEKAAKFPQRAFGGSPA